MKALFLTNTAEKIEFKEVAQPKPSFNQVLVKLKAAALNRRDQWMREGKYPNIQFDTILGSDGAGIVEAVGEGVFDTLIGQEVIINPNINWGEDAKVQSKAYSILGMPVHGTFAEYVAVDADKVCPKPEHLSWQEAAALPLGGMTAYRALFHHGQIKPTDNVLISGAGGGVAQFAFQFALTVKAKVFITSGDANKRERCLSMGATEAFNYKTEDWWKQAKELSGGFDLVIDSAGGNQINDFIKVMKPGGRIVFYGATNGTPEKLDMFRMFWNQITLQGSTMSNDQEFTEMVEFVDTHKIIPIIDSVRPFSEIISAFDRLKSGGVFGKLVVQMP